MMIVIAFSKASRVMTSRGLISFSMQFKIAAPARRHSSIFSGSSAGSDELYGDPALYELAFSYRDVASEIDVLEAWYERRVGRPPRRVLEVAAGPGAHALEFARRGAAVTALDASPTMCEHARRGAAREGLAVEVVEADMVSFRIPRRRFELMQLNRDRKGWVDK